MKDVQLLRKKAREIRKSVIRSLNAAGSGHIGGSLGLADVFSVLYFCEMKHRPEQPGWLEREQLILSIGHVAPVLYATLAEAGYFDKEELLTLRKLGTRLQGHPGRDHGLPGVELSAGSLGQGLGVAIGIALMDQYEKKDKRTFCIMGDGELQEGSVWEAAMSAGHYKLHNLIGIIDRNNVQIDGNTEDVMSLEPIVDKWHSFGWHVLECNGNDIDDIIQAFAQKSNEKPTLILAHTKMGCGVPEIENDYSWHGKAPNGEEMERFLSMLVIV